MFYSLILSVNSGIGHRVLIRCAPDKIVSIRSPNDIQICRISKEVVWSSAHAVAFAHFLVAYFPTMRLKLSRYML